MTYTSKIVSFIASVILVVAITLYYLLGDAEAMRPYFQAIADPIANFLRGPGDALRWLVLQIPLWVARALFILYYVAILVWVFNKDKSEVQGTTPGIQSKLDLRYFVAVSMGALILVYILW